MKNQRLSDDVEKEGRRGYLRKQPTISLMVLDFSNWAWIILQFSLQLMDTLKIGHLLLVDDFIFPSEILVKLS